MLCEYCVQCEALRWNLCDAKYESLNIKVNWRNNTCYASRLHHYLIKILRTQNIAKNSHISTVTSFIYFHFNNAASETVHFTTSLYAEEISRGFIVPVSEFSLLFFFFLTDVDKEERTWQKLKWEQRIFRWNYIHPESCRNSAQWFSTVKRFQIRGNFKCDEDAVQKMVRVQKAFATYYDLIAKDLTKACLLPLGGIRFLIDLTAFGVNKVSRSRAISSSCSQEASHIKFRPVRGIKHKSRKSCR